MHGLHSSNLNLWPVFFLATFLRIAAAQENRETSAQIGFSSNLNDSEIITLLGEHGVSPRAAFVWSYGLSGSYRTSEDMEPDVFLESVRSDAANDLDRARKEANRRLRRFVEMHSQEELLGADALQSEARSLLNYRKQTEEALATVLGGKALIFGLEIEGEQTTLDKIQSDPKVRIFFDIASGTVNVDRYERMSLKPVGYNNEHRDPAIMALSAKDLHSAITSAINE